MLHAVPVSGPVDALPVRLVEMLPGAARETLATVICGEVAARFDCPSSYLRVLRALVGHVGWHGNRVWASYLRLAALAGTVKKICVKTVQRAIRFFVRTVGLRILSDPGERLRGPGEHAYVKAGNRKQSEYGVNHYDLSALRAFVPRDLITAATAHEPVSASASSPAFPDPFAEPEPAPVCPASVSASISTRHACNVFGKRKGEGKPEKAPGEARRPEKFERTKLSDRKEGTGRESHGSRALALAGVSAGMRRAIIETKGELWARQAALYTRLQNERGEIQTTPARYLVAVFKTWEAEKAARRSIAWPDWLQARWEREQAAEARVVCARSSAGVVRARQAVRAPSAPSTARVVATRESAAPLSDSKTPKEIEAARTALRRSMPGAPAALIERLLRGRLGAG